MLKYWLHLEERSWADGSQEGRACFRLKERFWADGRPEGVAPRDPRGEQAKSRAEAHLLRQRVEALQRELTEPVPQAKVDEAMEWNRRLTQDQVKKVPKLKFGKKKEE